MYNSFHNYVGNNIVIAVDTVDLQQTTNLEMVTTSLTRQYSILINLQKHIKLKKKINIRL
jgi:hypothetical protein